MYILRSVKTFRRECRIATGMRPTELSTVVTMLAILMAAALFASFLPARRASRVDPVSALRQD